MSRVVFYHSMVMLTLFTLSACGDPEERLTSQNDGELADASSEVEGDAGGIDTTSSDTTSVIPDDTMVSDASSPTTDTAGDDVASDAPTDAPTGTDLGEDVEDTLPSSGDLHTQYLQGRRHSPITPYVAANLRSFWHSPQRSDLVFMKVGASSTVSTRNLNCFATDQESELGAHSNLRGTLEHFRQGSAAGATPFDRTPISAVSGRSAGWVIEGSPSPLEREIDAINPRFALIHYGTNDMQLGSTYQSAMFGFADNFLDLAEISIEAGIVPVLFTILPRGDTIAADHWVDTYNSVVRGVGQGLQVPVSDVHLALTPLLDRGLSSDGIHPNVYRDVQGRVRPCMLTEEGLEFGFNMRNLVSLEALERVRRAVLVDDAPDSIGVPLEGEGSAESPFLISQLPFTHLADTRVSPHRNIDRYSGCGADQDEAGPELFYRMELDATTRVRAIVFDRGSVDIDIHLLGEVPDADACIARDHRTIQGTLPPGVYHFSLDSFVSNNGTVNDGQYLFVLLTCHPDDSVCDPAL